MTRRKLVVHCKKETYDVYIGRPSIWGNPFSHLPGKGDILVDSREDAIDLYEMWIRGSPELRSQLSTLDGKVLGCWCAPLCCHGDVLLKLIEELHEH